MIEVHVVNGFIKEFKTLIMYLKLNLVNIINMFFTGREIYCCFSEATFSSRKLMFSGLSKSEKYSLEFTMNLNFHFERM